MHGASAFDYRCMARALQLARRGLSSPHPNPRVGCVIARQGAIVGSGWHQRAGAAHAEVNALAEAGAAAAGGTAYVTLEPCSHHGLTPPCTEALIGAGIARVVGALEDPNPEVRGSGFEQLRQAGVTVQVGLMAEQAEGLNSGFLMRMREGRPWVRVKLAQSTDGHTALASGASTWISGEDARADVQRWRAKADAIMTGVGTALADNPSLNVRIDDADRQPLRVIVDSRWRMPPEARLLQLAGDVLIAGDQAAAIPPALAAAGAECLGLPLTGGRVDLDALLQALGRRGINEVQVEAGAILCGSLLEARLVDELLIYQAPLLMGGDASSSFASPRLDTMQDCIHLKCLDARFVGADLRLRFKPVY